MIKIEKITITKLVGSCSVTKVLGGVEIEDHPEQFCLSILDDETTLVLKIEDAILRLPGLSQTFSPTAPQTESQEQKENGLESLANKITASVYGKIMEQGIGIDLSSEKDFKNFMEAIREGILIPLKEKKRK